MTLLNGGFLTAGLIAAAIPILIHFLFRRRRPPIDWAAMDILLAALRRQERRLRLEQLLLLAARCLLFAIAGLALARPVLEGSGLLSPSGGRTVTIVLDDGVVTRARDGATLGSASDFERLRQQTAELVRGLGAGDSVGVVLASRPVRPLVLPPTTDRDAVARAIESLEASEAATDLTAAMRVVSESLGASPEGDHVVVVASEFRLGALDVTRPQPAALVAASSGAPRLVAFPPATADRSDVAISSVEAQRAIDDDSIGVTVRLERAGGGNAPASVRVTVEGDGTSPVPPKTVRFDAGQATARVEFSLRASNEQLLPSDPAAGGGSGRVGNGAITARIDGDSMPANDARHAIFDARAATRIGVVARRTFGSGAEIEQVPAARWITRALSPVDQPGLEVAEIDPLALDARILKDLDALLLPRPELIEPSLWPEVRRFVDRGGLLLAMPSSETNVQRWIDAFVATFGLSWQVANEAPALDAPLTFAVEQPQRGSAQSVFSTVDAELPDLLRPIELTRRLEIRGASSSDVVLTLADGSPFLLVTTPSSPNGAIASRGLVALMTSAPELAWTNLPVKPFMVPLFQELVRKALARIGGSEQAIVAERPFVSVRDAHELVASNGRRVSLDQAGLAKDIVPSSGAWSVTDVAGRVVGGLPVNVEAAATRLTPQSQEIVAGWFAPVGQPSFGTVETLLAELAPNRNVVGAAVWLLAALLGIALVETIMARWFSHAANASGARSDGGVTATALRADEESNASAETGVAA